jgi:hypothetical protein
VQSEGFLDRQMDFTEIPIEMIKRIGIIGFFVFVMTRIIFQLSSARRIHYL